MGSLVRAALVIHASRDYLEAVRRVREYIFAGDIFQANLSQRFEAPLRESPWAFYSRLRRRNAGAVRGVSSRRPMRA